MNLDHSILGHSPVNIKREATELKALLELLNLRVRARNRVQEHLPAEHRPTSEMMDRLIISADYLRTLADQSAHSATIDRALLDGIDLSLSTLEWLEKSPLPGMRGKKPLVQSLPLPHVLKRRLPGGAEHQVRYTLSRRRKTILNRTPELR